MRTPPVVDNGGNDNNGGENPENPGNPSNPENPSNPGNPENPGDPTPPHTHSYTYVVSKYPTTTTEGERLYTCSCGDSYTEKIDAVTVALPSFADAIAAIIGEYTYTASLSENASFILVNEWVPDVDLRGQKSFLVIKIGTASISGKDATLKANLDVELGSVNVALEDQPADLVVLPDTFTSMIKLSVLVNGDNVQEQ